MLLTKVPMIEVTRFGKKRKLIFDFEINTKCITSWEYQKFGGNIQSAPYFEISETYW